MSMKVVGVKLPNETHTQLRTVAEEEGISVSEFLRHLIMQRLFQSKPENNGKPKDNGKTTEVFPALTDLRKQLEAMREQLITKDEQIQQLHQLIAMEQKNAQGLSEQLSASHQQLEDFRDRPPRWQFWRR